MKKPYFSVRKSDGLIHSVLWYDDPDVGPARPAGWTAEGSDIIDSPLAAEFTREGRRDTKAAYWRENAVEWVETESLSTMKERKRAEVTADRLRADADCFTYQGVRIRTADKDMFDLLIANARIAMGEGMPPNWPGGWLGVDGIVFISTREEWKPFFIAMYDAGIANFMHSQMLKAQIEDAATPAQIEAITW